MPDVSALCRAIGISSIWERDVPSRSGAKSIVVHLVVAIIVSLSWIDRARAIGWDSNDFLIGGGPSFTTRIGVFDHDLTFKGYLDSNFIGVGGLDFDGAGHLVAVASPMRQVRVYDAAGGDIVGGFTRSDDALGDSADLKVAPDGSYIVATQNFGGGDGARQFAPDGTFIRQLGSGWIVGAAVIPGNRAWTAGVGSHHVNVWNLGTGLQVGTTAIAGLSGANSMMYSRATNSVLFASIQASAVIEADLNGNVIRTFATPYPASLNSVTRGVFGDVFATVSGHQSVFRWCADGVFISETSVASTLGGAGAIVWAGNVPEPSGIAGVLMLGGAVMYHRRGR